MHKMQLWLEWTSNMALGKKWKNASISKERENFGQNKVIQALIETEKQIVKNNDNKDD